MWCVDVWFECFEICSWENRADENEAPNASFSLRVQRRKSWQLSGGVQQVSGLSSAVSSEPWWKTAGNHSRWWRHRQNSEEEREEIEGWGLWRWSGAVQPGRPTGHGETETHQTSRSDWVQGHFRDPSAFPQLLDQHWRRQGARNRLWSTGSKNSANLIRFEKKFYKNVLRELTR